MLLKLWEEFFHERYVILNSSSPINLNSWYDVFDYLLSNAWRIKDSYY